MTQELELNHKSYLQRVEFYRGFGYDLEKERDFILDGSLPISGEILEIGTGKGHFALALAKRGYRFTSIDVSAEEQGIARLNLRYYGVDEHVKLILADACRPSLTESSFDVIFSINVFHHLDKPEIVLGEIIRLLKTPGKIVLSDFNENGFRIINQCHEREGRHHDRSKHDLNEAKDYFLKRGFNVKESQSVAQRLMIFKR